MADSFLLRLPQVKARVGYERSQIYALIKAGKFPPPVRIGVRAVAWVRTEVENWIAARIAASRPTKPESRGEDGSTPQSKVPLPISRRRGKATEDARRE
jgi:prophage regulatory protein